MIRVLFVLCFFLCGQNEPTIAWDESYRLSWSDFKGKPNHEISAVALTASGISFEFSMKRSDKQVISFTAHVSSHFYPEQSWYKPALADVHVLGHEQLHFDITELFARKFRERITHLKVSNTIREELKNLNETINKELSAMQDDYDAETNYSRDIEQQAKWKVYITNELQKLKKYQSLV